MAADVPSSPVAAPPDPGRRRAKRLLAPLAGSGAYGALHSAAKAWDIRRGRWSEPELALVPLLARPGDTVVDVGANFGLWSHHLSRAVGPRGRVVAFEPLPFAAAGLRRVLRLLRDGNVRVVERAVGAEPGRVRLVAPLQGSGQVNAGLAHVEGRGDGPGGPSEVVECEVVRLDDAGVEGDVSVVKLDIEGAELPALRGAVGLLQRCSPALVVEVDPVFLGGYGLTVRDLVGFLAGFDYSPHAFVDGRLRPAGGEVRGNVVFLSPARVDRVAGLLL